MVSKSVSNIKLYGLDISITFEPIRCNPTYAGKISSLSITNFLRTVIHQLPTKGHLAAYYDQGTDFPGVAEVEDVDDAKEDLKDDGRCRGDEVHCLSPKVVDVLGNQKGGNKPERIEGGHRQSVVHHNFSNTKLSKVKEIT